jgi:hypothetical protein
MSPNIRPKETLDKALALNLDPSRYGTFAEIGAGQEVVRWFFRAGGAAGTIAKSISAYDMTVSDAIYGKCKRYVCRERLEQMLDYEYELILSRLTDHREVESAYFAFADTVVARSYRGGHECHGWMGIKFQAGPGDDFSEIIIHVRMLDNEALLQQEALGIVGVNLVHGAFEFSTSPEDLLASLLDGLSTDRIEVDMVDFSGEEFHSVDNRVMSLRLVQLSLSEAAMFSSDGTVLQASEVLRKKPVLVERGSFRPITKVNVDMFRCAHAQFLEELGDGEAPLALMEITMNNLLAEGELDLQDFLARVDIMAATGVAVLISDYFEFYRLAQYLRRSTDRKIAVVLGAGSLAELFKEHFYEELEGGILEAFGRLFKTDLKLFIYPLRNPHNGELITTETLKVAHDLDGLYRFLIARKQIEDIRNFRGDILHIFSADVRKLILAGDPQWAEMVPDKVAEIIRSRGLFAYEKPGKKKGHGRLPDMRSHND